MDIPTKYIPSILSRKDRKTQKRAILRSRKAYRSIKNKMYVNRPKLASFVSRKSPHVFRATNLYGVPSLQPTKKLERATGCKRWALKKIINKGEGAYYSSGSRPNQTAQSWGYARLGSALTGGPASKVDYDILKRGCTRKSRPIYLAKTIQ
jgi:hypothetical protein